MAKKKQMKKQTEDFVRRVLAKSFNQRLDAQTLREVAEKVSEAIPKQIKREKAA